MKISLLNSSGVSINTKSATVWLDPAENNLGKSASDLVILSDVSTLSPQSFDREKNGYFITTPGEYEVKGVSVRALAESAEETIYLIDAEKISLCYSGNLTRRLSSAVQEELGNVDVLLLTLDGEAGLEAKLAVEVMNQVEPLMVVLLSADEKSLNLFTKEMGEGELRHENSLTLTPNTLPQETEVVVLTI